MRGYAVIRPVIVLAVVTFVILVLAADPTATAQTGGGMDAMSFDMDPYSTPENARSAEYGPQCSNNADDDGDTRVNDGCATTPAAVGTPENGIACNDPLIPIDNDLDGSANDGCSETSCLEALDSDGDGAVNDGCPSFGPATLGSRETCARIVDNGLLDGDEDSVDALHFDVTAMNIPASNPMIGFAFTIEYPSHALTIEAHDPSYLIAAYPRSSLLDVSDSAPDDNADNRWSAAVADTSDRAGESGTGVLSRIVISAEDGAPDGIYALSLTDAGHIDHNNDSQVPLGINNATIAVGASCPTATSSTP